MRIVALVLSLMPFVAGCARSTAHLRAVEGFSIRRYAGKWYEIARFPHPFERGLQAVTAEYTVMEGGEIRVVNRGYDVKAGRWKSVTGRARPAGEPHTGLLEVTFFWPFWGGYRILDLDHRGYSWALVTGDTYEYLWILARRPDPPGQTVDRLVEEAESLGFDTDRLEFISHGEYH